MKKLKILAFCLVVVCSCAVGAQKSTGAGSPGSGHSADTTWQIDRATLDLWSAPYRGWHYYPEPVIPSELKIPGYEKFQSFDVPTVYQIPGQEGKWFMSFIGFNGQGYNSFVVESRNLIDWTNPSLAMGFGKEGEFDFGGCAIGAYLYESYGIKDPRLLKKRDGLYWTLYGSYAKQGGYEIDPGYEGVAGSTDGLSWKKAKEGYILSVHEPDAGNWEKDCIYQPWLVEADGRFYDFYNAKHMPDWYEQMGAATSADLLNWKRVAGNPIVRNRPGGYDEKFCSDGKVFRVGDHWVMFYFGVNKDGAHIMAAFSRDLLHWTAHPEPLYKAGGHPGGLDKQFAHKISLVYNKANDTFYMYYCAVGNKGRCIGLLTSREIPAPPSKAESLSLADIHIRDPYVVADPATGTYYLYASIANRLHRTDSIQGVEVYNSKDLVHWDAPRPVYVIPASFWAHEWVWAPEVHPYQGRYYLFVTFTSGESLPFLPGRPVQQKRGTQVLVADKLTGPFKPFQNRSHTPVDWMALDGTLWVEDGQPYMVFSHEWIQLGNGTLELAKLKSDLSDLAEKPVTLFKAGDAPWVVDLKMKDAHGNPCLTLVTDGPFLYRTSKGKLLMIWSSFSVKDYTVGIAESVSGKITGPWKQQEKPLFTGDGGHAMIFRTFDGRLMLSLHKPNQDPDERAFFYELTDNGETLSLKGAK